MTDRTGFVSHIMPDPLAPECATCGAIMRRRGGCNPFAYECASCGGTTAQPREQVAPDHLAEVDRLTKQLNELAAMMHLMALDECFVRHTSNGTFGFTVNCNDMFYPASDAEAIDISLAPRLWEIYQKSDWMGVVRWVQENRNGLPLRKVREDRVSNNESLLARAEAAEQLIREIADTVSSLPSVTGLSPVKDVALIPLAIRDLQAAYRDAARSRNGQYTKLEARLERMQKALKTLNSRWGVRSGECYTCDLRHGKHSSDCPIPEIKSLLAEALEEKP